MQVSSVYSAGDNHHRSEVSITKIAFFCDFFSSLGGTENYNLLLIKELIRRGIEVRVYIGERPRRTDWLDRLSKLQVQVKMPGIYHEDLSRRDIEQQFIDEIADEIAAWHPDVIHTHPFKKMAICWLSNSHTDSSIPIVATEWTVPTRNAAHWFEPDTADYINDVSAYIATCKAAAHGIREYHGYKGPIFNIPHLLAHPANPLALPTRSKNGSFSVGCVARLSVEKGVTFLIGAWRQVLIARPTAKLHLYGHGSDEASLRELCDCLGVGHSVLFEGTFAPGDISVIAAKHDFFVQPSLFESIPTSTIELMACGRAVIATRVGGLPELVVDHKTGLLVDVASTDQLSSAILELGDDHKILEKLSENAYEIIAHRYKIQRTVDEILSVYRSVVVSRSSSQKNV